MSGLDRSIRVRGSHGQAEGSWGGLRKHVNKGIQTPNIFSREVRECWEAVEHQRKVEHEEIYLARPCQAQVTPVQDKMVGTIDH